MEGFLFVYMGVCLCGGFARYLKNIFQTVSDKTNDIDEIRAVLYVLLLVANHIRL